MAAASRGGRIIPAWAGNISVAGVGSRVFEYHLRVGGEYLLCLGSGASLAGSSPRVRGIYPMVMRQAPRNRIIPACAGNMRRVRRSVWVYTNHPRVCGEYARVPRLEKLGEGSSPRVWGISE